MGMVYCSLQFHIIEILTGHPLLGYRIMAPALDVAFDHAFQQHPFLRNLTERTRIYRADISSCIGGEAEALGGQLIETVGKVGKLSIILSTGRHGTGCQVVHLPSLCLFRL